MLSPGAVLCLNSFDGVARVSVFARDCWHAIKKIELAASYTVNISRDSSRAPVGIVEPQYGGSDSDRDGPARHYCWLRRWWVGTPHDPG